MSVLPDTALVLKCAIGSRVLVVALCAAFDAAISDYDTSHSLTFDGVEHTGGRASSAVASHLFGWSAKWDGAYFSQIAMSTSWPVGHGWPELGYDYENYHAFFPMLPALLVLFSGPLCSAGMSLPAATLVAGVFVSNAAFVLSAVVLYRYSCLALTTPSSHRAAHTVNRAQQGRLLGMGTRRRWPQHGVVRAQDGERDVGQRVALVATLLYCVNPASVFMSAIYTESLFALFTISGMLLLHSCRRDGHYGDGWKQHHGVSCATGEVGGRWGWRWWASAFVFGAGAATRGNGVVYAGFLLYESLHSPAVSSFLHYCRYKLHGGLEGGERQQAATSPAEGMQRPGRFLLPLTLELGRACLYVLIVAAPFLCFQRYSYQLYCTSSGSVVDDARQTSISPDTWCNAHTGGWLGSWVGLPSLHYSHVQERYWNVGLLRYWELKQLPNFGLAAPMLTLTALAVREYACADPARFFSLGFTTASDVSQCNRAKQTSHDVQQGCGSDCYGGNERLLPHVYLWSFLGSVALLIMHIQVATRFLAVSPAVYWFAAARWIDEECGADTPALRTDTAPAVLARTGRKGARGGGATARRHQPAGVAAESRSPSPSRRNSAAAAAGKHQWRQGLLLYFLGYLVIGCGLFSNYYPWT